MAFGKDSKAMGAVASFRQASGQFTQNKREKKKGGLPYYVDKYEPSTTQVDVIRLVPGEYLQDEVTGDDAATATVKQIVSAFIKFTDHFDGQKQRGAICSAGPFAGFRSKRAPCHGCEIYWATAARNGQGRFESTRMSKQGKYAFSVFDLSQYHKMDQVDKDTLQPKINQVTKLPYFNWVKCQGELCDACRSGLESKMGHMTHWPMNFTQLEVLRSCVLQIGRSCAKCSDTNCISSLGWMTQCCGAEVVDMHTTSFNQKDLLDLTDKPYTCTACQKAEFLVEVYECRTCASRGQSGVRATLFDVNLNVQYIVGANNQKALQVGGWSVPHPLPPQYAELAKPIDLVARYAPTSLEEQAFKFGVVGPVQGPRREPATGPAAIANPAPNPYQPPGQQYATPQPPQQQQAPQQYAAPYGQPPAPPPMYPAPQQQQQYVPPGPAGASSAAYENPYKPVQ